MSSLAHAGRRAFLALAITAAMPLAAHAQYTVAENFFEGFAGSTIDNSRPGWWGAENFSLTGSHTITSVSMIGFENGPGFASTMDWVLFGWNDSTPSHPGSILFRGTSTAVRTNLFTGGGFTYNEYTAAVSGVTLGAGNYWVGYHLNGNPMIGWVYASTGSSMEGLQVASQDDMATWGNSGGERAFSVDAGELLPLESATPEPGGVVLMLTGMGALFGLRHRIKRTA